jgi:CheY-like chemotaxis protein
MGIGEGRAWKKKGAGAAMPGTHNPKLESRRAHESSETSLRVATRVSTVRIAMDGSQPLAGKRVLIAEDEPWVAMDHAAAIVDAGAEVVATCATVRTALNRLAHEHVDVAVVDYVLGDRNSEPLQAALKQHRIPFVVVSAYPRSLVRIEPGQEVLRKPASAVELRRSLQTACTRGA